MDKYLVHVPNKTSAQIAEISGTSGNENKIYFNETTQEIWNKGLRFGIGKTGPNSGLDADTVDGYHASTFLRVVASDHNGLVPAYFAGRFNLFAQGNSNIQRLGYCGTNTTQYVFLQAKADTSGQVPRMIVTFGASNTSVICASVLFLSNCSGMRFYYYLNSEQSRYEIYMVASGLRNDVYVDFEKTAGNGLTKDGSVVTALPTGAVEFNVVNPWALATKASLDDYVKTTNFTLANLSGNLWETVSS